MTKQGDQEWQCSVGAGRYDTVYGVAPSGEWREWQVAPDQAEALTACLNDLEARLTAAIAERDEYKRCYEVQREVTNNWQAEAEARGHKTDDAEAKVELLTGQLRHVWDEHGTQYRLAGDAEAKATKAEEDLQIAIGDLAGTQGVILLGLARWIHERQEQWAPRVGYWGGESKRHPLQAFMESYDALEAKATRLETALNALCDELDSASNRDDLGYIKSFLLPIARAALTSTTPKGADAVPSFVKDETLVFGVADVPKGDTNA